MKNIATKLLKILLVITLGFTSIFNGTSVAAMETIKNLIDEENVEKIYSEEFLTEEEAETARLEEIEKFEAIKEEKAKDEIEFLYYVSKLEQNTKTVPTTIEDLKEKITEYESNELIKTTVDLENAKQALIDSYALLNDENNIYNVTITIPSINNPVKVDTTFKTITYDTLNDALTAIGDKDLTPVKIYDEDENEDFNVDEDCANSSDCNTKKSELENNENYINVVVEVIKNDSAPKTETITLENFENKTFVNNEEDATLYANALKNAILEYISDNTVNTELQKVNITTVELDDLSNILSTTTETVYQTTATNISGTFKSEEAARLAVVDYINELKKTNNLVNVDESLKNVTITENFVEKVTLDTLFDENEDALAYFAELQENETNYTLKNPDVVGIDEIVSSDDSNINEDGTPTTNKTWDHLDIDATDQINILDEHGHVITTVTGDVELTSVYLNGTKKVEFSNNVTYDTERNAYEYRSRGNVSVRSGDIVTIDGYITYKYNNVPHKLHFTYTGKILDKNNTCEGRPQGFDLSISGIDVTEEGKVVIEIHTKYKLTYDMYNYTASVVVAEDKTTSVVTVPTITKTTIDSSYKLVGSYTEKGYDYQVTFPEDVMEDRFSFKASISHKSKPATKDIDVFSYYTQTLEILPKGGDEDTNNKPLEEAPKTGNNESYIGLIAIALLVLIKKIVK